MSVFSGPEIVNDGVVLALDAANPKSYPGSGTTWFDLSGLGNNGSIVNAPTFSNGTFTFNGSTQYIDIGTYQYNTAQGSISFWTKLTSSISIPHSGNVRPWGKSTDFEARWGGGGNTTFDAGLAVDLGASIGPPATLQSAQNTWSNSIWYNIVTMWNTSNLTSKMYIQGQLNAFGSCNAALTSLTGNFYIGRSPIAYYAGDISMFTVYNRELSSTEIQQNFNATRSRYGI